MWRRLRLIVGGLLCAVFCAGLLLIGAALLFGGSASTNCTLQSGRTISTSSDSWYLSCEFQSDTATIRTAGHEIVVAPRQLRVDGTTLANIDPAAKSVSVTVEDGAIEFVADQRSVATWTE
jgi:hypothetical protein